MLPSYYYEKRKRKKGKLLIFLSSISLILLCCLILFVKKETVPFTDVLKQTKAPVLQKTATLKLSTLYSCGHQKNRLLPLPENLINKTETETQTLYPDWILLKFEEQYLEAEEKTNTVCDNHFLIRLSKNKIIVTRKNTPNEMIMEEKINPSVLTDEDKDILSSGISVNSEFELLEILESFR